MQKTNIIPTCSISHEPSWLNRDYIAKIMEHFPKDGKIVIEDFKMTPFTSKGENYFSKLYLLSVSYRTETDGSITKEISFVLKSRLENDYMATLEESFDIFGREAHYYKVISKEMQKVLKEIGDTTVFGPEAIYIDDRVIVLENLKIKGFCINDVKLGLNLNQCRLVVQKLGKYHALSMFLYKKNPDMFRFHLPGNISEHPSVIHELYTKTIKTTIEYCSGEDKLNKYVQKLEKFSATIIAKLINVYSRNLSDRYHVLNHGDLWINNLMFQKPNDKEILFIDFQEGYYGSAGIDWNYFIFTSWQPDVFQLHFNDLVIAYHEMLTDVLHKLNFQQRIPSIDDVKKEIINKAFHGLATATCLLPILINEHPELAESDNFILDNEEALRNRRKIFNNSNFGERLKIFLKHFEDIEVL